MKICSPITVFSLLALSLLGACATTAALESDKDWARGVEVDRSSWSEEQRELEMAFEEYLQSGLLRPEIFAEGGPQRLSEEAEIKAMAQQQLEGRFRIMLQSSDDPDVVAWASFRLGQVYLDFGCRLVNLDTPTGLEAQQRLMYREAILELSVPLMVQSEQLFDHAIQTEEEPWFGAGQRLKSDLSRFSEAPEETCESTAEFWYRENGQNEISIDE